MDATNAINRLCLACGLCCNGVLFRDVELQRDDDAEGFRKLGLTIQQTRNVSRTLRLAQPCPALCSGNQCRVYAGRPKRCHDFECGLLKDVIADTLEVDSALSVIRRALRHVARVKSLLRQLDDADEHLPLARRFRRVRRRLESSFQDEGASHTFAELTQEVHRLNLLTQSRFYTLDIGRA